MEILEPGRPIDPELVHDQLRRWHEDETVLTAMMSRCGSRLALIAEVRVTSIEPVLVVRREDAMLCIPWPSKARCYTDEYAADDDLPSLQIWLHEGECLLLSTGSRGLTALAPWLEVQ